MRRARRFALGVAVAAAVAAPGVAAAAETGGCGKFAWPVDADMTLIAAAPMVESGATLDATRPTGARVVMVDADKAGFAAPPTRPAAPDAPAGVVSFEAKAGLYQFTVTDRVWLDVVQDGRALPEAGFSGVLDCDGARKSVRFELKDGRTTVQFSGSPARTVAVAITRDPPGGPPR